MFTVMKTNYKLLLTAAAIIILILGALVFLQPAKLSKVQKKYEAEIEKNKVMVTLLEKERAGRKVEQSVMNHSLDSLQKAYKALVSKTQGSGSEYVKVVTDYNYITAPKSGTDSVSVAQCDSVINAADNYIEDLKSTLVVCDSTSNIQKLLIKSLVADTVSFSESMKYLTMTNKVQGDLINSLKKYKLSWWQKNKFWVGFVAGTVSTTATVYLVNKHTP